MDHKKPTSELAAQQENDHSQSEPDNTSPSCQDNLEQEEANLTQKVRPADLASATFDVETPNTVTSDEKTLVLYVSGRTEPIVFEDMEVITIGRSDEKTNYLPMLDLSKDNALGMGISRRHAQIDFTEGQFFIKDTGSTNGTWINNLELKPFQPQALHRGDLLRLGRLVILIG